MSGLRSMALTLVGGVALGIFSRGSDLLPRDVGWVGNLGALWLAAAFLVGAHGARRSWSSVMGAGTLAVAAVVHYGSYRLARFGSPDLLRYPAPQWAATGVILGGVAGAAGSLWDESTRWVAVSLLMIVLGAEAFYLGLLAENEPNALPIALPIEMSAFALLPLAALREPRERLHALAVSLALVPPGALAIAWAEQLARRIY